jgi:hypothetical protein
VKIVTRCIAMDSDDISAKPPTSSVNLTFAAEICLTAHGSRSLRYSEDMTLETANLISLEETIRVRTRGICDARKDGPLANSLGH